MYGKTSVPCAIINGILSCFLRDWQWPFVFEIAKTIVSHSRFQYPNVRTQRTICNPVYTLYWLPVFRYQVIPRYKPILCFIFTFYPFVFVHSDSKRRVFLSDDIDKSTGLRGFFRFHLIQHSRIKLYYWIPFKLFLRDHGWSPRFFFLRKLIEKRAVKAKKTLKTQTPYQWIRLKKENNNNKLNVWCR